MATSAFLGYLTWWTIPDCAAPYVELNDLAGQAGFPAACVPTPPAPRHAWEKATNVGGTRGLKLDVPPDLINQTFIQYGVEPAVRLLTRRVSDAAPVLRRHLVREAVIPVSSDHWKQLSLQTVAVLEFNCRTQCSDVDFVYDAEGWSNGNVHAVVRDIEDRQHALLHLADGNDIREGVRQLLLSLHRVALRGTGGVYFIPEAVPDAERTLRGLRSYIKGLLPWKTGQLEPACNVVRLNGEDAAELREDIKASAIAEFQGRLTVLAQKVEPILQQRVKGKVSDGIAQAAAEELLNIKAAVTAYQASLHDNLAALTDMLTLTQTAVLQAMGMLD